ncbi:MAG: TetR family transcriptional regulator C-terminal domain-containing protein [Firmicutes bacterium]|nr:TetR family transcriptional regulator C-terminal domain-containing protein [Bacillota bacterium]
MSDRRIRYTKKVLKESLLELMAVKSIGKIQIKEICDLADVNRGTFYNHYNDQFDLLRQVQDEFASEVNALQDKRLIKNMSTLEMITELLNYFAAQLPMCKILFDTNGGSELISKLMNNAYDSFLDGWRQKIKKPSERQLEMLYVFISNGAAAIIRNWVANDLKETPQEIAQFILQATNYGSSSFVS